MTVAFDLESDIDATLSCYYYHNRNGESASDKGNGVWVYEFAPYDYEEEAEITDAILEGVPETIEFTVSGNKIVGWEAVE